MFQYKGRYLPLFHEEVLEGASETDAVIIASEGWLQSAGVVTLKKRTDVATMRMTCHFRSINAESPELVKEVLREYLEAAYRVHDIVFFQSGEERRMSKSDISYFHCICSIGGTGESALPTNDNGR